MQVATALEEATFLQGAYMAGYTILSSSSGSSTGPARVLPPAWPAPELMHPSRAASESRASANSRASARGPVTGNPPDSPKLKQQQQAAQRCSPGKGTCRKAETLAGIPECAFSVTEVSCWEAGGIEVGAYAPAMVLEAAAVLLTALSLLSTFCRCVFLPQSDMCGCCCCASDRLSCPFDLLQVRLSPTILPVWPQNKYMMSPSACGQCIQIVLTFLPQMVDKATVVTSRALAGVCRILLAISLCCLLEQGAFAAL